MAMAYENLFTGMFSSMSAVAAASGIMIVFMLLLVLAVYVYASLALMKIADRTKTKDGWLSFVPVGNIYLITKIAKVPGWWTIGVHFHNLCHQINISNRNKCKPSILCLC